ncbi:MAG TPA: DISARM system phospholipase D-like protein DrmC [Chloroflexaceae bacterium]|nr:DISARM system phospholipase D-like protein DrmC [Chloroflexaceae bacterium]
MSDAQHELITAAVRLAERLPAGTIQSLAAAMVGAVGGEWEPLRHRALQVVPQPETRALVADFLATWRSRAPAVTPSEAALMLRTAAVTTRTLREAQSVELVWTGPLVGSVSMRRTDQALLQVINSARHTLLIVSFAVYKIPAIAAALVRAAGRGVSIRICVEAPEPSGQKMAYDTIKALGADVAQHASIYVWPSDRRPVDGSGHTGVLHAKCAVADDRLLFVSSANLTDHALNLNIELGALIYGGSEPGTVAAQFERLIADGTLRTVQ